MPTKRLTTVALEMMTLLSGAPIQDAYTVLEENFLGSGCEAKVYDFGDVVVKLMRSVHSGHANMPIRRKACDAFPDLLVPFEYFKEGNYFVVVQEKCEKAGLSYLDEGVDDLINDLKRHGIDDLCGGMNVGIHKGTVKAFDWVYEEHEDDTNWQADLI